jgi:hypothetical protein
MENYFCDGSTFAADANRYKIVWRKNAQRYEQMAREKCCTLFAEIEALNEDENRRYGDKDLEETGQDIASVTNEAIAQKLDTLNKTISATTVKNERRKAASLKNKLEHISKV